MNAQPQETAAVESLLAFWRDAGVDACYLDAPVDHTHVELPAPAKAVQKATASVAPPPCRDNAAQEARALAASAATLGLLLSHRRLLIARFSDFTLPVRARVPREHKRLRRELLHQLDRAVH